MRFPTVLLCGVVLLLLAGCERENLIGPLPPIDPTPPPVAPTVVHAKLELVSASVTAQPHQEGGTVYSLTTLELKETSGATEAVIGSITLAGESDSALSNEGCWRTVVSVPAGTTVDVAPFLGYCDVAFWSRTPYSQLRVTVAHGNAQLSALVAPIPAE